MNRSVDIEYRYAMRPAWCRVCGTGIIAKVDKAFFARARSGKDSQVIICKKCAEVMANTLREEE